MLDTALAMTVQRHDVWWLPELLRLKSELEPPPASERLLHEALETARAQHSRSLEERIITSHRTFARTIGERPTF